MTRAIRLLRRNNIPYIPPVSPPSGDKLLFTPPGYPSFAGYTQMALSNFMVLDDTKDYIINVGDYVATGGPSIIGGRNVVIRGGRITINASSTVTPFGIALWPRNGAKFHIEGLRIRPNPSDNQHLHDGILIRHNATYPSNANSRIVVQNCLVGPVSIKMGYTNSEHADVMQFQSDYPGQLWMDRLTGLSDYSGFMLSNFIVGMLDIHRANLRGYEVNPSYSFATGVALYQGSNQSRIQMDDFWVEPWQEPIGGAVYPAQGGRTSAPSDTFSAAVLETDATSQYLRWPDSRSNLLGKLRVGVPSGGDFVTEADVSLPYSSPGYV